MPDAFNKMSRADQGAVNAHIKAGQTKAPKLKEGDCPHKKLGKPSDDVEFAPPDLQPIMVCLDCGQYWR